MSIRASDLKEAGRGLISGLSHDWKWLGQERPKYQSRRKTATRCRNEPGSSAVGLKVFGSEIGIAGCLCRE
jgi:hypothetical protein